MSRGRFRDLFQVVFGKPLDKSLADKLYNAEKIRDKVLHGKDWTDAQAREALVNMFDFAENFNDFVYDLAGFKPFSDLRGFKGRKQSLPKPTTRWVLRGMGIGIKKATDEV